MRAARAGGEARLARAFESLYEGSATGLVASSSAEGFDALRMLKAANPAALEPANGARYPRGRLGTSMQQIAQLIRSDLGRWPGLAPEARFEARDLAVTTDFRALFGEVLNSHLGPTDISRVFPGFQAEGKLGLFG